MIPATPSHRRGRGPRAARRRPARGSLLALLAAGGLALAAACGSSGGPAASDSSGSSGDRMRVTLRGYSSGQLFELVSESHTNRVDYYSQSRADAARKIQADEVLEALIDEMESRGFDRHAKSGRAPTQAATKAVSWGFELEVGDEITHWLTGSGAPDEERLAFQECMSAFLQLYNVSASYQTIENPEGPEFFDEPRAGSGGRIR